MQPTNELRFVRRRVPGNAGDAFTQRILQQKWREEEWDGIGRPESCPLREEWRDVPVEDE